MLHGSLFSIPVSRQRQISMTRRFIVFSAVLFLLIFSVGSAAFVILMKQILHHNAETELKRTVEIGLHTLENNVNCEITLARRMAASALIRRHLMNPGDILARRSALEEIAEYRQAFAGRNVYWISDRDKKYHFGDEYLYTLDPAEESSAWYNALMEKPVTHQLAVNFDVGLQKTMLWIDAPVLGQGARPVGLVGTALDIPDFVGGLYEHYQGDAELYLINAAGEITGADDIALVENKVNLAEVLGRTGRDILAGAEGLPGTGAIKCFETEDKGGVFAVASIPALGWYMVAVNRFTQGESLRTGLTVLFGVIMAVIFFCFAAFNIFVARMLEPLNRLVRTVNQALSDWELKPSKERRSADEIGTLGELLKITIIDPLTGVYNRRYMDGHLKKVIKSMSRSGGKLSLLMVDVDFFKKYNDTYGHDAGDNCLRAVAAALAKCLRRDGDLIARYGGDEFAVILPNTDKTGAQIMADKLLKKVRACNIPNGTSTVSDRVTVSIGGITGLVYHLEHGSGYIKRADKALFESKKNGRDRATFEDFEGDEFINLRGGI